MGIDLETLIKVPAPGLEPRAILKLAVQLARRIGHEHFYINKSLPENERYGGPEHHAISACPFVDDAMIEEAKGWRDLSAEKGRQIFQQDGDPILADVGEQLLRVHWFMRYYGVGYERGHWPTMREAYLFLYAMCPKGTTIWHGGDSSGVCVEPMGADNIRAMDDHWFKHGNEPYGNFGFDRLATTKLVCPCCEEPMKGYGMAMVPSGTRVNLLNCDGCGREAVLDPKGESLIGRLRVQLGMFDQSPLIKAFGEGQRGIWTEPRPQKVPEQAPQPEVPPGNSGE